MFFPYVVAEMLSASVIIDFCFIDVGAGFIPISAKLFLEHYSYQKYSDN